MRKEGPWKVPDHRTSCTTMVAGRYPGTETVYIQNRQTGTDSEELMYAQFSSLSSHFLLHATCFVKARPIMPCISLV